MQYALVLMGKVLPDFTPESAWPGLAAYLRMEPDRLAQLVARAPLIVKQEENLGRLKSLKEGIAQAGAEAEIFASDGRPALSVAPDGDDTQYGPMPSALVDRLIKSGRWAADSIRVAEAGSSDWRRYPPSGAAAFGTAAQQDALPAGLTYGTVVSGPATRPSPATPSAPNQVRQSREPKPDWTTIPAGAAIHAGFWPRCAAMVLDGLILLIPMFIAGLVPFGQIILPWLYFALMDSSQSQATLGKRALGIKVVDQYGESIGFGRASWRYFSEMLLPLIGGIITAVFIGGMIISLLATVSASGKSAPPDPSAILSFFSSPKFMTFMAVNAVLQVIYVLTFLMAAWTRRKQTLYDMMAGTFIVFKGVEPGCSPGQRPSMPWYGWVLNILPFLGMALALALASVAFAALREAPAYIKMLQVASATETIARQGCQPGERGLPDPSLGTVEFTPGIAGVCKITLTLADSATMPDALRGQKIDLVRNGDGGWSCSSSMPAKYMPPAWSCK